MLPTRYSAASTPPKLGGFGSAEVIHDNYLGRDVILKTIINPADNDQLLNEIRHLSSARSRHVVEIYDVILDENKHPTGIILEYLSGRDFFDFHKEAQSNIYEYLKVLFQIATALYDLHKKNVIHRDLKLDNLKESSSGILKIFDFGISNADDNYHTTNSRATLVYAAPEYWCAPVLITAAMDIYAFGICAWKLATQAIPSALLQMPPQTSGKAPSISSVITGLSEEIIELLDSCLNITPRDRPSSEKLKSVLGRHLTKGKHKGVFVVGQRQIYELNSTNSSVNITLGNLGAIQVKYNNLNFIASPINGDIYINNQPLKPNSVLPEACVLTFGDPSLKHNREWVTFSSSRPEVVL